MAIVPLTARSVLTQGPKGNPLVWLLSSHSIHMRLVLFFSSCSHSFKTVDRYIFEVGRHIVRSYDLKYGHAHFQHDKITDGGVKDRLFVDCYCTAFTTKLVLCVKSESVSSRKGYCIIITI